ncbi:MAG: hypothetical protein ABA06_00465 [Parcubacteria bacterium C7867-001]|nr:MAG: hypothetical protein ABA06_00465 [Parcubacteria bacterium C7867-001]
MAGIPELEGLPLLLYISSAAETAAEQENVDDSLMIGLSKDCPYKHLPGHRKELLPCSTFGPHVHIIGLSEDGRGVLPAAIQSQEFISEYLDNFYEESFSRNEILLMKRILLAQAKDLPTDMTDEERRLPIGKEEPENLFQFFWVS